jgi:hypothetical protein
MEDLATVILKIDDCSVDAGKVWSKIFLAYYWFITERQILKERYISPSSCDSLTSPHTNLLNITYNNSKFKFLTSTR